MILRKQWFVLCLILLLLGSGLAMAQPEEEGRVRFVHALPGGSPVDIYVNGQLTVSALDFGSASGYILAPAGPHTLTVTPAGITTELWQQQISISGGSSVTLVAATPNFTIHPDELSPTRFGETRFSVVHAISGGATVDVMLTDGTTIAPGVNFGSTFGTFDVSAGVYSIEILSTGTDQVFVAAAGYPLNAMTSHMLIVYGPPGRPQVMNISAPVEGEADSGFVRFAHSVVDGPDVDVLVNGVLIAPALAAGTATEHLPLPAGSHEVTLRLSGADIDLFSDVLSVESGEAATVVALGPLETLSVQVYEDAVGGVSSSQPLASLVNTIPESDDITVTLSDGTVLVENLPFGASSGPLSLPAGTQTLVLTISRGGISGDISLPVQTFYGGVYYNILALAGGTFSGPTLAFVPTVLAQTVGSAAVEVAAVPDIISSEVVEAPSSEVVAQPVVEPTPAPTSLPIVIPPEPELPTARLLINPGANMHIRRYPSADAESLVLVPSGSVLSIEGREGPEQFIEGQEAPADLPEFVDPATLLESEDADLVPAETWLFVIWITPDGGRVTGWANALVLEVRDARGRLQRLADLPLIARNRGGTRQDTALTSPAVPENRVNAIVTNLNPGVNLLIRRERTTEGEVLARVPLNTVLEFVGVSEDREWVYLTHYQPEGGIVTGWGFALYLRFEYNGRSITIDQLEQRELLTIIPDDRRGTLGQGLTPPSPPTPDPTRDAYVAEAVLNPGSNVHLRIGPDSALESCDLIPGGTRMIITGRTEDGLWLNVTFEGQLGWVTSTVMAISYNGRFVEVEEVPIAEVPEVFPPCR